MTVPDTLGGVQDWASDILNENTEKKAANRALLFSVARFLLEAKPASALTREENNIESNLYVPTARLDGATISTLYLLLSWIRERDTLHDLSKNTTYILYDGSWDIESLHAYEEVVERYWKSPSNTDIGWSAEEYAELESWCKDNNYVDFGEALEDFLRNVDTASRNLL